MVLWSEGANAYVAYIWSLRRSSGVGRAVVAPYWAPCCAPGAFRSPGILCDFVLLKESRVSEEPGARPTTLCHQDNGSHDCGSTGGCASPEGTLRQSSRNWKEDFQDEVRLGRQENRFPGRALLGIDWGCNSSLFLAEASWAVYLRPLSNGRKDTQLFRIK